MKSRGETKLSSNTTGGGLNPEDHDFPAQTPRSRIADVISEVGGPAPVLFVGLLEIGFRFDALAPASIAAITMAVIPYAALLMLERSRKVSDRFVRDRKERMPILLGTLVVFAIGAIVVVLMGSPPELIWVIAAAITGLVVVTLITLTWKISIHATITAFFVGLQMFLFGPWGLVALIFLALVLWSRWALRAHTVGQLAAGTALGGGLAVVYVTAVRWFG